MANVLRSGALRKCSAQLASGDGGCWSTAIMDGVRPIQNQTNAAPPRLSRANT